MCTQPIHIKNPKFSKDRSYESQLFNPVDDSLDKHSFLVPCGECYECRQVKMHQNQIRVYYECLECEKEGYNSFFNALTYDEQHVPKLYGLNVFSYNDLQLFLKRLRKRLKELGYEMFSYKTYHGKTYKVSNFKYFIAPEYGSKFGRPHYHLIFNCHFNISAEDFCKLVDQCWQMGYTQFTNPYEPKYYKQWQKSVLLTAAGAIQYVAKYCNKDLDFIDSINNQDTGEFLRNLNAALIKKYTTMVIDPAGESHAQSFFTPLDSVKFRDLKHVSPELDNCIPHCRYSQRYGIYALNVLTDQQLMSGKIPMPDKFTTDGIITSVVPYFDNKLFYDYDKSGKLRRINSEGLKMRDLRFKQNIDYVENQIFETSMYFTLNHHEYKDRVLKIIQDTSKKYAAPLYTSLEDFISENNLLSYNTRFAIAAYRTLLQGLDLEFVRELKFLLANEDSTSYISDKLHCGQVDWFRRYSTTEYQLNCNFILDVLDQFRAIIGGIKAQEYLIKMQKDRENKEVYDYYTIHKDYQEDSEYCQYLSYIYNYEDIFEEQLF